MQSYYLDYRCRTSAQGPETPGLDMERDNKDPLRQHALWTRRHDTTPDETTTHRHTRLLCAPPARAQGCSSARGTVAMRRLLPSPADKQSPANVMYPSSTMPCCQPLAQGSVAWLFGFRVPEPFAPRRDDWQFEVRDGCCGPRRDAYLGRSICPSIVRGSDGNVKSGDGLLCSKFREPK